MNPLHTANQLIQYTLFGADGEIGTLKTFYFDDASWKVRYLIVNTGSWLGDRRVLISPIAIGEVEDAQKIIDIELTRKQIENSPPISTDRTVSMEYEKEFHTYYNWAPYWQFDPLPEFSISEELITHLPNSPMAAHTESRDNHLRNSEEVVNYSIEALDDEIGHVENIIIDTRYWVIRYLEIATRIWRPGKHVLISTDWIEAVNWKEYSVTANLIAQTIETAPAYNPSQVISRDYEEKLFRHYRRPVYWRNGHDKH